MRFFKLFCHHGGHKINWRDIAQSPMWSYLVIMATPLFYFFPGILQREKPALVQTFLSAPTIKGFYKSVISGFAWPAEI